MKDAMEWLRTKVLFDGEGAGEAGGEAGGGGGGAAAGDQGAGSGDAGAAGAAGGDSAGEAGAPTTTWRDTYLADQDFREDPSLLTIPDVPTLAKNYLFTKKKIGEKGIIPPKEGAGAEEWGEFFSQVPRPADDAAPEVKAAYQKFMGAPETADAYNEVVVVPDDFPKEFLREDLVDGYKQAAFEAGVPPVYAKAIFDWYMGKSKAELGTMPPIKEIAPGVFVNDSLFTENRDKVAGELKAELGDTYDATLARVQAAVVRFGGKELAQYYDETGLGNHPATIKAWMNVVNSMSEDKTLEKGGLTGDAGAQARLDEIARDPDFLDQWSHPDKHKALIDERDRIMAKLHPGVPGLPEK